MTNLIRYIIFLFLATSCSQVRPITKDPKPGIVYSASKKYLVKKIRRTDDHGTYAKLKGLRWLWFIPSDTIKKGDSICLKRALRKGGLH